jgi:hypothetical protein
MPSAATKLVLLALVTLWASGADLYLHQQLDHHSAQLAVAIEHARQSHWAASESIDNHGCLTCSILAMMIASGCPSPTLLPTPQPTATAQTVASERPPHRIELPTPPVRGPPSLI